MRSIPVFCVAVLSLATTILCQVPPAGYKFQLGAWLSGEAGTPAFSPAAFNKKLGYNLASYQAAQSIPPRLSADKTIAYADPDPALFGRWFSNVSNWDDGTDASVFMTIYADTILADGRQGLDVITDEMIIALAHRLNAIIAETGRKVYMRWLPEMNGDWMLYGKLPAQYVAMWNRMGAIMRANAPRVILVWSPNFDLRAGDTSYWFVEALLHKCKLSIHARPGPQYVDMVGTSVYFKGFGVNYAIQHGYASGSFDPVYSEYAQKYNLPFIVSECSAAWETGPGRSPVTGAEFASVSNEVTQATFQKQFWEGILSPDIFAAFPLLHSAYIFEVAKQEEFFSDFRVAEEPAVLAAFKSVIQAVDNAGYMLWANKTGPHTSSTASSDKVATTKVLTTAVATGAKQSAACGIHSTCFIFSFVLWICTRKMTATPQRRPSVKSNVSSTMTEVLAWKPRLFLLIAGFISICAITVGVLGWQLTMAAGKDNVASMMEQIEFLISNQVSLYILQAANSLTAVTRMQQTYFEADVWSFSTAERAKATYKSMLISLNAMQQYTTSFYMQTYPGGEMFGYFYHTDKNGTRTLRWWSQVNMSVSINLCTPDGSIIQPPISVNVNPGSGTLKNPGNNNTLQNAVGGTQGADLEYAVGSTFGYSNVYLWDSEVYKTAFAYSINPVTHEQVTFANDWTLKVISDAIQEMLQVIPFPMFAAVIEAKYWAYTLLKLSEINDPFLRDFSNVVNSTYTWGGVGRPINDLPSQLSEIYAFLEDYYPGNQAAFTDRKFNGVIWKLGLNTAHILGNPMLFIIYMNVDSVEEQLNELSAKTGYMMIGIILAFVTFGAGFTIIITRQLAVVSRQIRLLKDLKFKEVLGGNAEIKDRSFIYELAELQKCFYSMVIVFSELLKTNSSIRASSMQHTGSDHAANAGAAGTAARGGPRPMGTVKEDHTKSAGASIATEVTAKRLSMK
ncbi:UNVERIFIED_CONTAM: hypothetical protein HDU68_002411 [Siphonaria sp. JEL0065]|nr:hypothetical protein HDU68_002411 [Siphonaria sp. JEL0065]